MKQLITLFLFSFWFLLLVILGDSYLGYYLFGVGALLQLGILHLYRDENLILRLEDYLFLPLFIFLGAASLFSVIWPRTLFYLASFSLAYIAFCSFKNIDLTQVDKEIVFRFFEFIGLVMVIIGFGLELNPRWGELLPGFNLIYASYGHSHSAAYLLMIIPASWWLYLKPGDFKKNKLNLLVPLILTLGLLVSFGRVAIVLGFAELIILVWFYKQRIINLKQQVPRFIKMLGLFLLALFILVLSLKAYFSLAPIIKPQFQCPLDRFATRLCKALDEEPRPKYWGQALRLIKHHPWLGTGPGTYASTVKKYVQNSRFSTAHAHNYYLRISAELGIVGGLSFLFLMGGLYYLSFKKTCNKSELGLDHMLLVGVGAMYVNNLFDFDWHFISLYTLTLIFLALILNQVDQSSPVIKRLQGLFKTLFYFSVPSLIALALLFFITNQMIRRGNVARAFALFPYFHWHSPILAQQDSLNKLSKNQRRKLFDIYRYDPQVLQILQRNVADNATQVKLRSQLAKIDPWSMTNLENLDYYLENKQLDQAHAEIKRLEAVIKRKKEQGFREPIIPALNQRRVDLAYLLFDRQDYAQAGQLLLEAYEWEPWILDQQNRIIAAGNSISSEQIVFFRKMNLIPSQYYGTWQDEYASYFFELALRRVKEHKLQDLDQLVSKIIDLKQNQKYQIKDRLFPVLIFELKQITSPHATQIKHLRAFLISHQLLAMENLSQEEIIELKMIVQNWAEQQAQSKQFDQAISLLTALREFDPDDYWSQVQLGNLYLKYDKVELAQQEFENCLERLNYQHKDCYLGLEKIRNASFNRYRYDQVKQIIAGEKNWQDFE